MPTRPSPAPEKTRAEPSSAGIQKAATGIAGFDEITGGGVPRGRVTLVLGGPGAGKTVFALQTLVNGAREHKEPGIFVALEENSRQVVTNAGTFGWDLDALERERLFFLDARLSPATVQSGEFDLNGLLAGISAKAKEMNAKRIVFDGIDVLLTLLNDTTAERREMYRLYEWLQTEGVTGIITGKAAEGDRPTTDRYAFMQFMVDCVVLLQHKLQERVSMRTLRVMKYRGTGFSESEFPMVISERGINVSTFTAPSLDLPASTERMSTGVGRLDTMLSGGYYRGSSVLITGAPGTTKTTLSAACVQAACARGENAIIVSFDEGSAAYVRNLASVGINLQDAIDSGRLIISSIRTQARSSEEHLLMVEALIRRHKPTVMVIDPISALAKTGGHVAASHAAVRVLDFARTYGTTSICTSLVANEEAESESTMTQISTIADTWIHLAYLVKGGERNRTLTVVKSRGTKHSSQVRELMLSHDGVSLADVYSAGGEVLVGTARWEREQEEAEQERNRALEARHRRARFEAQQEELSARISALQREMEVQRSEFSEGQNEERAQRTRRQSNLAGVLERRKADADSSAHADKRGGDGQRP